MGAGASVGAYQASIDQCVALLKDKKAVKDLWTRIDFNGNGYVSLAEIDKMVVEMEKGGKGIFAKGFNNKPALMRAYKASCMGGRKADWVERREFPFLLRNMFFFDQLWDFFDAVDTDDDRRIDEAELTAAISAKKFAVENPKQVFDDMDTNDGGKVLFDEFCIYVANKYIDSNELDKSFEGTKAAGKPPRKIGRRKKKKNQTGRGGDAKKGMSAKFDEAEAEVLKRINDKAYLDKIWGVLDFNGNRKVSLAEIDKMCVEQADWQLCNNKPALMRAYKFATSRAGGGDGDAYVEKKEFKALLANLFYFNKLFYLFEDIDTGDDRRIDLGEFLRGVSRIGLNLSVQQVEAAFDEIDRNDGGQILFDEFCIWVRKQKMEV